MKNLLLILLLLPVCIKAQEKLMIQGTSDNLYLSHTVAPKENFYSVGRLYNISPKEIAPFNNLILENGITIGQTIKVPLKPVNFMQTNSAEVDEAAVPVFHKVEAKETLRRVSSNYNKVPVASLKAWNNLSEDDITPGQDLIIGYLKVKKDVSPLALKAGDMPAEIKTKKPKEEKIKKETSVKPKDVPAVSEPDTKKQEDKETEVPAADITPRSSKNFKGGVFKSLYNNTGKEETGSAGVFKSTSGWEDGKYYCLHNSAPQGAVVKITNTATGKHIYAKVLDVMPDLSQNSGLLVRLSNAGADALGAGLNNFSAAITY